MGMVGSIATARAINSGPASHAKNPGFNCTALRNSFTLLLAIVLGIGGPSAALGDYVFTKRPSVTICQHNRGKR